MNFIHRLKSDLATRDAAIAAAQQEIQDFLQFLGSDKFTGTENGERKDWIATGDVVAWLQGLRSTLEIPGSTQIVKLADGTVRDMRYVD